MALNPKTAVASRNLALDAAFDVLNSGKLRGYDSTQPTDADTALGAQVLLFDCALNSTAFAAASAGDVKISKDGGSFANTTNTPTEIASTGRYSVVLTSAEMDASWVHIMLSGKSGVDDIDLKIATSGHKTGLVVTDGSNTASTFKTDLTESANDHWKDALLLFVSGTLAGQVKKISAFNASTDFVTLSGAFTGAPSNGDRFVLVNI